VEPGAEVLDGEKQNGEKGWRTERLKS
jgi:hypothetical protein